MFDMPPPSTTAQLREWVSSVGRLERAGTDAERVDRIRLLEELKSAAAAAQAVETVAFADVQERRQREFGVPAASVGKGIGSQVGLAKRESPARASRYLGWSRVLTRELPVKKIAYRLDPKGYVERAAGRARDRRVTLRPAPETMSHLSGYLPVAQGVAGPIPADLARRILLACDARAHA